MDQESKNQPQPAGGESMSYMNVEDSAVVPTYDSDVSPDSAMFRQEFLQFPASLRDTSSAVFSNPESLLPSNLLSSNFPLHRQFSSSEPSSSTDATIFYSPVQHFQDQATVQEGLASQTQSLFTRQFQDYDISQISLQRPSSVTQTPLTAPPNPFEASFSSHVVLEGIFTDESTTLISVNTTRHQSWPNDGRHGRQGSLRLSSGSTVTDTEGFRYLLSNNVSQEEISSPLSATTTTIPPCPSSPDPNLPKIVDGIEVKPEWGLTKAGKARQRLPLACINCRNKKIKCIINPSGEACENCLKNATLQSTCRTEERPRRGAGTKLNSTHRVTKRRNSAQSVEQRTTGSGSDAKPHARKGPVSRHTSLAIQLADTEFNSSPEKIQSESPDIVIEKHALPYLRSISLSPTKTVAYDPKTSPVKGFMNQAQDLGSTERMPNFELFEDQSRISDLESKGIGDHVGDLSKTSAMVYHQTSAADANTQLQGPFFPVHHQSS